MAIKPSTFFDPSRVNAPTAAYPQGSAKAETSPGANDGTPIIRASVFNDLWGFFQKLLDVAGITPSGTADSVTASDYYDAMTSNDVKSALASIDAGDVGGDRSVENTGKGINYGRSAIGIYGTSDVRTDVIALTSIPTFTETSSGSRVWRASALTLTIPSMPAQVEIISASLVFDYEYDPAVAPGETYQILCPINITHSDTAASSFKIGSLTAMTQTNPSHASASGHRLYVTYMATW